MLDDKRILAHIRASKAPKPGAELLLGDDESIKATMLARHGALFEVEFNDERPVLEILNGSAICRCRPILTARTKTPTASSIKPSMARAGRGSRPDRRFAFRRTAAGQTARQRR